MDIKEKTKEILLKNTIERILLLLSSAIGAISAFLEQMGLSKWLQSIAPVPLAKAIGMLLSVSLLLATWVYHLKRKKKLIYFGGLYWLPDDPVAFCPRCKEADEKQIHMALYQNMIFTPTSFKPSLTYECPNCPYKSDFWLHPNGRMNKNATARTITENNK